MLAYKPQWAAVALALLTDSAFALVQTYCSSQNTGSGFTAISWPWQSNGYCHDQCMNRNYAYAIVQDLDCWCSNYTPSQQTDVSSCDDQCPGYGDLEHCGNGSAGLFGYVVVNDGAVQSSLADTQTSTTAQPVSIPTTGISSLPPLSTSSSTGSTSSTFSTFSTFSSSATSKPATSSTPTPVTSTQVITVSGAPVTKTVTSTPPPTANNSNGSSSHSGLSGGATAGVAIGAIGGVAAIAVAAFLLWRRRRTSDGSGRDLNRPKRTTSMLSRTGLLSRGRAPSMSERNDESFQPYNVAASNSARHSMLFNSGHDNVIVQPASPLGSSHGGSADLERRQSRPMLYDQRLNPTALFANAEANGSRVSMQDQHDYSRTLGIANPDPRSSFESRISR